MLSSIVLSDLSIRLLAFRILCSLWSAERGRCLWGQCRTCNLYVNVGNEVSMQCSVTHWKLDTRLLLQQFLLKGSLGKS